MAYQSLRNWYCLGPAGKLGVHKFAISRGLIFESQAKYRAFWDVFVQRGDLRYVRARPTHVFKEGDFRPVKGYGERPGEFVKKEAPLPKPLQKMSKTWLGTRRKAQLLSICHKLGFVSPELNDLKNGDLIMMILNEKEAQAAGADLPDTDPKAISSAASTQKELKKKAGKVDDNLSVAEAMSGGAWGQ